MLKFLRKCEKYTSIGLTLSLTKMGPLNNDYPFTIHPPPWCHGGVV
jgi:hypothetical protein